jgi:hypothetical protein
VAGPDHDLARLRRERAGNTVLTSASSPSTPPARAHLQPDRIDPASSRSQRRKRRLDTMPPTPAGTCKGYRREQRRRSHRDDRQRLLTGQPATDYIRDAIAHDRHVITTNKGPVGLFYPELSAMAAERGVALGVEGTVMGGTPILRVGRELLAAAGVERIQGILNGTTNYILTRMAEGESYEAALREAQKKGYAEANPSADVDGYDAAVKIVILSNLLLGIR